MWHRVVLTGVVNLILEDGFVEGVAVGFYRFSANCFIDTLWKWRHWIENKGQWWCVCLYSAQFLAFCLCSFDDEVCLEVMKPRHSHRVKRGWVGVGVTPSPRWKLVRKIRLGVNWHLAMCIYCRIDMCLAKMVVLLEVLLRVGLPATASTGTAQAQHVFLNKFQ